MDTALCDLYEETVYTKEEVISTVRGYLCKDVFGISPEDMSHKSVILVCGTWALRARLFKKTPDDSLLQQCIDAEIAKLRTIRDFELTKEHPDSHEYPIEEKTKLLEEMSNISDLETRYVWLYIP